jgi:hypothetical protein
VLRRNDDGAWVAVDPLKTVFAAGDMVRLRVASRESGFASIHGVAKQPIHGAVSPLQPYETADIRVGDQDMQLIVSLTTAQPLARQMVSSLQSSDPAFPATEVVLRVKKR